jgi:hypothetical protein
MGWEVANLHLGTKKAIKRMEHDLQARGPGWLQESAEAMNEALAADFKTWRSHATGKIAG